MTLVDALTLDACIDAATSSAQVLSETMTTCEQGVAEVEETTRHLTEIVARVEQTVADVAVGLGSTLRATAASIETHRTTLAKAENACLADVGTSSWRARQRLALLFIEGYGQCAQQQIEGRPKELDTQAKLFAEKYDGLVNLVKAEVAKFEECFRDLDLALDNLMKAVESARTIGRSVNVIAEASVALPVAIDPVHDRLMEGSAAAAKLAATMGNLPNEITSTVRSLSSRISSLFGDYGVLGRLRSREEDFLRLLEHVESHLNTARDFVHDDVVGPIDRIDECIRSLRPLLDLMKRLHTLGLV